MSVLGTIATAYGVVGAFSSLLQTRAMLHAGSAREISIPFLALLAAGHGVWLAYGLTIRSGPLVTTDSIGLVCGGLTCLTALRLTNRRLGAAGGRRERSLEPAQEAER